VEEEEEEEEGAAPSSDREEGGGEGLVESVGVAMGREGEGAATSSMLKRWRMASSHRAGAEVRQQRDTALQSPWKNTCGCAGRSPLLY
jgi:hypothetical protein